MDITIENIDRTQVGHAELRLVVAEVLIGTGIRYEIQGKGLLSNINLEIILGQEDLKFIQNLDLNSIF